MDNSIFEQDSPPASQPAIAVLIDQANDLIETEKQLAEVQDLAKVLSSKVNELKTRTIPEKMAEVGLSEFTTPEGFKVQVDDFVSGTLPKDPEKREVALKEIVEWGSEDIIKSDLTIEFSKSHHNEALALVDELRQRGLVVGFASGIHPQTYLSMIRERLRNGEEVYPEKMGIFVGRKTKVTPPKKGK